MDLQIKISPTVAIQQMTYIDFDETNVLTTPPRTAPIVFLYPNPYSKENFNSFIDGFFSPFVPSSSHLEHQYFTITTSLDIQYLNYINWIKNNFIVKPDSDFRAYYDLFYDSYWKKYNSVFKFDFFNLFEFKDNYRIKFGGFNYFNKNITGLTDDSLINNFNGILLEVVLTHVSMYSVRKEDGFMMPISVSVFKYRDRWVIVYPDKFTVECTHFWNGYYLTLDSFSWSSCCLAECFGITN